MQECYGIIECQWVASSRWRICVSLIPACASLSCQFLFDKPSLKVKRYGTYGNLLISRYSGVARVNEGSHSCTCHPRVYPQANEPYLPLTPSHRTQRNAALQLVLISCPTEARRLSWPGWVGKILRWFATRRQSPIPVFVTVNIST